MGKIYLGSNELINTDIDKSSDELLVDMGLPSGLLWATRNIDVTQANGFAKNVYQYECSFFSWGNTDGHNPTAINSFVPYSWGNADTSEPYASSPGASLTASFGLSFDAAFANLGNQWRMPTTDEFAELFNNIDYINPDGTTIAATTADKRVTVNGVIGILLKSKNNSRTLFFPCSGAGYVQFRNGRGLDGNYWSSSLYSRAYGLSLLLNSSGVTPKNKYNRYLGFSVRPVQNLLEIDTFPDQTGQSGKFLTTDGSDVSWGSLPEYLTIIVTSNQEDKSDITGATVTVTNTQTSASIYSGTWQGSNIELSIPTGTQYSISVGSVTNYSTPSAVTGTALAGRSRGVTMEYKTEVVTVRCSADDNSSVAGQTVTVNGVSHTLDATGVFTQKIAFGTAYTVVPGFYEGYDAATQNFTANSSARTVYVVWEELKLGVFIESTDHKLYTAAQWDLVSKTANSIVLKTTEHSYRISLGLSSSQKEGLVKNTDSLEGYITPISDTTLAKLDYDGAGNTTKLMQYCVDKNVSDNDNFLAPYCRNFTFPDGTKNGYAPASGEVWLLYQNSAAFNACLTACGITPIGASYVISSTVPSGTTMWGIRFLNGNFDARLAVWGYLALVFAHYE